MGDHLYKLRIEEAQRSGCSSKGQSVPSDRHTNRKVKTYNREAGTVDAHSGQPVSVSHKGIARRGIIM